MEYPEDLYYSQDHTWVRVIGNRGTVGITNFAQQEMGEILYTELPTRVGRSNKAIFLEPGILQNGCGAYQPGERRSDFQQQRP